MIRTTPGISRQELKDVLGLSQPSVARHVTALIKGGLVEQGAPIASRGTGGSGATIDDTTTGRPTSGLFPTGQGPIGLGAHIGLRSTALVATDALGHPLAQRTLGLSVPDASPEDALEAIGHALLSLAREQGAETEDLQVGLALSPHVDNRGRVSSRTFGWEDVDPGAIIAEITGVPTSISTGVSAMAGFQLMNTPLPSRGADSFSSTLYFYARELVAHAWIFNGAVHKPHTGTSPAAFRHIAASGSFAGAPEGAHPLGTTSLLRAAGERGIRARTLQELVRRGQEDARARALLDERAHLLGKLLSLAVDVVDPENLVVAGETFTTDPRTTRIVADGLRRHEGPRRRLHIHRAGEDILANAASAVALNEFRHDPLKAL